MLSARTLNPKIIASVARARFASDSEIPPTPLDTIFTFAKSLPRSCNAAIIASHVPPTSVLTIIFKTFLASCPNDSKRLPADSSFCFKSFRSFSLSTLCSTISLA